MEREELAFVKELVGGAAEGGGGFVRRARNGELEIGRGRRRE